MLSRIRSLALATQIAIVAGLLAALSGVGFVVAQGSIFIAQPGLSTQPSIYSQADAGSGLYFGAGFVGLSRHISTGLGTGTAPALATCGTSPALGTGSTDAAGKITVGTTAANACTLTFGVAYTTAPFCVVQNATTGAAANVYAVSTTNIVWSSALADSSVLFYHCIANSGG